MSKGDVICHVTDSFFPEVGGVERVVENLAVCQAQAGRKVLVVTKSVQGAPAQEEINGVQVFRFSRTERPTPRNYFSSYFGSAKTVAAILKKQKVNVAHCHLTLSAQGPISVFQKARVPIVCSFYGPWHKEFWQETKALYENSGFAYRQYIKGQIAVQKMLQRRMLHVAKKVITLSHYSIDQALELLPGVEKKCTVIPGGIENERFFMQKPATDVLGSFKLNDSCLKVLTVRRLVHRNGVDLLVEAIKICAEQGRELHLYIGGRGAMEEELKQQVRKLGLEDRVSFLGFIEDEKLPDAYRQADLFVIPTRAEENFGLPIVESAASGTPVVGTAVGSIPEVLGYVDERMLAEKPTAQSIADKIMWYMDHKTEINEVFNTKADLVRQDFSWMKITGKIQSVYEEAIR